MTPHTSTSMCAAHAVYLAHNTFSWRDLAAHAAEPQLRRKVSAAPLNKAEGRSAAAHARKHIKAAPLSTGDVQAAVLSSGNVKASITAVTAPELLLPTSIDQQGGPGPLNRLRTYPIACPIGCHSSICPGALPVEVALGALATALIRMWQCVHCSQQGW